MPQAKKRKLNKQETAVVKALDVVIKYLLREHPQQSCGEYNPSCPACLFYVTAGHIQNLKSHIEY